MSAKESLHGVPEKLRRVYLTRQEILGSPELETSVAVIAIAGKSYTGKTGFAERLAKRAKFPKSDTFLVGQRVREAKQAGQAAQGYMERDRVLDEVF